MKVTGKVIPGEGIAARVYDTPTANLSVPSDLNIDFGVYAGKVLIEEFVHSCVICYGAGSPPKFEVHILDYNRDIFGVEIQVEVLDKVSEFIEWTSVERMRQKILDDLQLVREMLNKFENK